MKTNLIYLSAFFILPFVGFSQSISVTFSDAWQLTLLNNKGLKESESIVQMKNSEMKAKKSLYLPSVSLGASYAMMSDDIHLDLTPVRDAITPLYSALGHYGVFSGVPNPDPATNSVLPILPQDISTGAVRTQLLDGLDKIESAEWNKLIQKKQFGVITAQISYPLYAGGKIHLANHAAKVEVDEALNEKEIKSSMLLGQLTERYYAKSLAIAAQQVRQEVFETMERHLYDAKRMKEEGMIANAEYLHIQVFHAEADRELKKAIRNVKIVNQSLINTLDLPDSVDVITVSPLFYLNSIENLEVFLTQAHENNLQLKKIEHKLDLVKTKIKSEKSDFLPTIALMGTYDIANKDLSPYMPDYMVGVGMKWNLFEGFSRINKYKAAQFQEQQVNYIYDKGLTDIDLAVTNYYQQANMQLEQISELDQALVFANEYVRVRNLAFNEGLATVSEVGNAALSLAKVKIERIQAIYQFQMALSNLYFYAGMSNQFLLLPDSQQVVSSKYE